MSSRGTGSDISLQDAIDLLHKLMTEFTKVVGNLGTASGVRSAVCGKVKVAGDGTFWVIDEELPVPPAIIFDPQLAVRRTYGDSRSMSPRPTDAPEKMPRFESALCFEFADGTRLCLFGATES